MSLLLIYALLILFQMSTELDSEGESHIETSSVDNEQCEVIKDQPLPTTSHPKDKPDDSKPSEGATGGVEPDKKKKKKKKGKKVSVEVKFPTTLEGFGYHFIDGRLRNIKTGEPFVFAVKPDDKEYNQKHYEALGEVITDSVYNLLETERGLQRVTIPLDRKQQDAAEPSPLANSFIFVSDGWQDASQLLVLIHGSGVVRAGQWARRLIINDCLDSGTQLPFIKKGLELGYGIVVLNTNRNTVEVDGKLTEVPGSETPEKHGQYVWTNFIKHVIARTVHIVAHSYGGVVTVEMIKTFQDEFTNRVKKIAFTDSVHVSSVLQGPHKRYLAGNAINWVTSSEPLDTPIDTPRSEVPRRSANTLKHEETSFNAMEPIFKYFKE